jgi:hypothetical protein
MLRHIVGTKGSMKTIIATLVILFAFLAAPAFATPKPKKSKRVHATQKFIFHFKGEKKFYC